MLRRLKSWAKAVKCEIVALWLAARDPRTPWTAKAMAVVVVAYALSPIDLIPDFVPVLGYLDDLILLPLGIFATVVLIPPPLMAEFRREAATLSGLPPSKAAAVVIVLLWLAAAIAAGWLALRCW